MSDDSSSAVTATASRLAATAADEDDVIASGLPFLQRLQQVSTRALQAFAASQGLPSSNVRSELVRLVDNQLVCACR